MPGRNRGVEYDILLVFHESEEPLTSMDIAQRLRPRYFHGYSSWVSFKNFVIKKLKRFWKMKILELDGERYSHNQR